MSKRLLSSLMNLVSLCASCYHAETYTRENCSKCAFQPVMFLRKFEQLYGGIDRLYFSKEEPSNSSWKVFVAQEMCSRSVGSRK